MNSAVDYSARPYTRTLFILQKVLWLDRAAILNFAHDYGCL